MPPRSEELSLADQKDLIRKALTGNRWAKNQLALTWLPRIRGLARQVRAGIVHSRSERIASEDLEGEGWVEVWRLLPRYKLDSNAKPLSWMHDWIVAAMTDYACKNLEIVPLKPDSANHAAHRELEQGGDAEEIAGRRGMSLDRVRSLIRHTVSVKMAVGVETSADPAWMEDESFHALSARRRLILSCLAIPMTVPEIAALLTRIPQRRSWTKVAHDEAVVLIRDAVMTRVEAS